MEQINIYFRLRDPIPGNVSLGFAGDNDVRRLAFSCRRWSRVRPPR